MTEPKPKRCAVAACGREPTQIEYYETNPGAADGYKGAAATPVCGGHTGYRTHDPDWRLAGVTPIPGRVHSTTPPPP